MWLKRGMRMVNILAMNHIESWSILRQCTPCERWLMAQSAEIYQRRCLCIPWLQLLLYVQVTRMPCPWMQPKSFLKQRNEMFYVAETVNLTAAGCWLEGCKSKASTAWGYCKPLTFENITWNNTISTTQTLFLTILSKHPQTKTYKSCPYPTQV